MEDYKKTNYCTQVQVLRDGAVLKSLIFNQDKIIIGRILSVDLVVDDISISRIHAAIDISEDGRISVSDLGSVNGIEVDGKKVAEMRIASGSRVKLGDIELIIDIFREEDVEEDPQPRAPIVNFYSDLDDVVDLKRLAASRTRMVSPGDGPSFSVKMGASGIFPIGKDRERGTVLEGVLFLNESIIEVKHIERPRQVTVGPFQGNDFVFGGDVLPGRLKMVKHVGGRYLVTVTDAMKGFIQKGGNNISLDEIKKDPSTESGEDGQYTFPINYRDIVRIEVGRTSLMFLFVARSAPIARKPILEPDPPYHTSLFISFVLHLLLILIFKTAEIPQTVRLERIEDRFINLIIQQKKPIYREKFKRRVMKKKAPETKVAKKKIVKKKRPEKKIVKKKKPRKKPEKKVEIQEAPDVNIDRPVRKVKVKPLKKVGKAKLISEKGTGRGDGLKRKSRTDVKKVGILGALRKGGAPGSLSKLFGKRGIGRGRGRNVIGPRGVRGGMTGIGFKEVGGGGVGKTFGIGSGNILGNAGGGTPGVVTSSGAMRGRRGVDLRAFNALKGSKYTGVSRMVESNTVVLGSLSKEQIYAVVEKHFSEIQNCYEVALQGDKNLSGKVTMKWIIGGDGRVKSVRVKHTSLRNIYAESCMRNRIRYWLFPRPRGGGIVRVEFPFVFKPL